MAMTLRLSQSDEKLLAALAAGQGISRHEAAVRSIREEAARRGHEVKVGEISTRLRERFGDQLGTLS